MIQCPKCHYIRTEADSHIAEGVCPSCGIAYAKWQASQQAASAQPVIPDADDEPDIEFDELENDTLFSRIAGRLLYVPERVDPVVFWGRVLAYVIFFIWGWWFIFTGGDWTSIGNSFMHNINLPFHEFGHVIFRPFGRFMTILGGSLFQVMMPLIVMAVFIRQYESFESSLMLWWAGQNFIDLSPYISDAEYRGLPLISGMGEDSHDWGNLLTMMHAVDKAYLYGKIIFAFGSIVIIASLAWGGYILYRQKQKTTQF